MYILSLQEEDNLPTKDNTAGPKVSFIQRLHCMVLLSACMLSSFQILSTAILFVLGAPFCVWAGVLFQLFKRNYAEADEGRLLTENTRPWRIHK